MKAVIVGGTSGLGLALAHLFRNHYDVVVVGRKDPEISGLTFEKHDLSDTSAYNLNRQMAEVATCFNGDPLDLVVYAAGYFQKGKIDQLSVEEVVQMIHVGMLAPILLMQRIFQRQDKLPYFIPITSTSQWTPRLEEPVYCAVKAGLGMLTQALALDPRIERSLLVAPSGMNTNFWANTDHKTSMMLSPVWVAEQIFSQQRDHLEHMDRFRFIKILRDPARVEIEEQR